MRLINLYENVNIDNFKGMGAVPKNQDVDYFGLKVMMTPNTFLTLASDLNPHPKQLDPIVDHLKTGGAIGSPFLIIDIPQDWFNGKFVELAEVAGHEGRHRMHAVQQLYGNIPVEVHIWFTRGVRARDLTDEIKQQLRKHMIAEKTDRVVHGPLFELDA